MRRRKLGIIGFLIFLILGAVMFSHYQKFTSGEDSDTYLATVLAVQKVEKPSEFGRKSGIVVEGGSKVITWKVTFELEDGSVESKIYYEKPKFKEGDPILGKDLPD